MVFIFKLLIVTLMLIFTSSQSYGKSHKVLVLHSYHQGLEWTDSISAGINSILQDVSHDIEVHYDYLDTKRNSSPFYHKKLIDLFKSKQGNRQFDLIITSDNNAFEFIKTFGQQLYPGIPVIFCGVNFFSDMMISDMEKVTGVVEKIDYKGTLEVMLTAHPNRNKILVITDQTNTGKIVQKEMQAVAADFKDRVTFEYYNDFTWEQLPLDMANLSNEYLIYLLAANSDNNLEFVSYKDGINLISQNASVPIYGSWDFYLGKGIVGGVITSGFVQGELVAKYALKVLAGEGINDLPIIYDVDNKTIFDFAMLEKFAIKQSHLPANSEFINQPDSFLKQHATAFFWITLFTLAAILLLLLKVFTQKRKQVMMSQVNLALDQRVKDKTLELSNTSEKLSKLINTLPSPVFYKDIDSVYQMCNDAFAEQILGLPKDKIIGCSFTDLANRIPADLARIYRAQDIELIHKRGYQAYETKVKCADNTLRDYIFYKATLSDSSGDVSGIVGVMHDITDRKKSENNLKESEERFRSLQDVSFEAVAIHKDGVLIDANHRLSEMTGYDPEELIGMHCLMLFSPSFRDKVDNKMICEQGGSLYEAEAIKKDGTVYPIEVRTRSLSYQGQMARVGVIRDVTEQVKAQKERSTLINKLEKANKQLSKIAITDALTGISNRGYIFKRFSEELKQAKRYGSALSIVMFDIDFFKRINDSRGHQVGDMVIQEVSQCIQNCIRDNDLIGRYGGEEFLLILPHTNIESGYQLASRIRETIASLAWDKPDMKVTISGGIAEYNGHSEKELLQLADKRLYQAKSKGRDQISKS